MRVGDLFTVTDVETFPCRRCGRPSVMLYDGPIHFERDPNGAKTAWNDCKPADVAKPPTLF
ncbi:hypothetical protein Jolie2_58 [Mycobacterium phage Jolie2]|uniref:Uncharacterized protein n=1 Tax=Mycobacterium phage Jolie2 TaxID=1458831 RepID=W8EB56_9CAUD|nr:hypothetical protein Jolie2_58 [Mycobacterium phage Jolie2]AHJ86608.1 hypothetical protein Jolie2_58 [Mycobacterium phage Jolie2]